MLRAPDLDGRGALWVWGRMDGCGQSRPPTWEQLVVIGDAQEEGQVVADVAALGVYEDVPAQAKAAASRGEKRFVPEGSAPKAAS